MKPAEANFDLTASLPASPPARPRNEVWRRTQAIAPAEEAVALYRALAAQSPDAFRSDLAIAWWDGQPKESST